MNWRHRPSASALPRNRTTRGRRTALSILIAAFLMSACGSVPKQGFSTASLTLPPNTTVGVRSTIGIVSVDTSGLPYAPANAPTGAMEGALVGTLSMSADCLLLLWVIAPVCALFGLAGGVEGAKLGTLAAQQAPSVEAARESFLRHGGNAAIHRELRQRIVNASASGAWLPLVDLGETTSQDDSGPARVDEAGPEPGAVIEIGVDKITISYTGGASYGVTALAKSRIVDAHNGKVLGMHDHLYIGPSMTLDDWHADDGRKLREVLSAGLDDLAHDILERCCARR